MNISENLVLFLFVFGLIVITLAIAVRGPSADTTQETPTARRGRRQPSRPLPLHQRRWFVVGSWWIGAIGLALAVFQTAVLVYGGPFFPIDPEIHPQNTVDGSSLILPFTIKNRSAIPIINATMICGVDLVYARDAAGTAIAVTGEAAVNGNASFDPMRPTTYNCDASDVFQVRADGTLAPFGSETQFSTPSSDTFRWKPPFQIVKMCIWVRGESRILGLIPWNFTSEIYQWPAAPGLNQWLEGFLINPDPAKDPFGSLPWPDGAFGTRGLFRNGVLQRDRMRCGKPGFSYPYGLFTGKGPMVFRVRD